MVAFDGPAAAGPGPVPGGLRSGQPGGRARGSRARGGGAGPATGHGPAPALVWGGLGLLLVAVLARRRSRLAAPSDLDGIGDDDLAG